MNKRDLIFALRFQTANEAQIKKAAAEIKKVARATNQAEKETKQAGRAMRQFGIYIRGAGRRIVRFSRVARSAFVRMRTAAIRLQAAIAAIGIGVGLVAAIRVMREFEFQLARLSAITGNIGKEMGDQFVALEQTARRLGATTEFTAGQVANGLRLLAQAGFDANEAIAAIPGTLNLAIAATTDLGTATTIVANTIRGFGLSANEATKVTDVLTATTQESNTTIELLGEALKFIAPAAQSANQSIETTAAALGVLSDAGLKGTLAGTGLRRVLVGLINPTKAAQNAFARLGLQMEDLDPRANDLGDIFERLNEAGFGAAEAFEAFGLRGGPAALVISNMYERFVELNAEIKESEGRAQAFADRINDTLRGSLLRLRSAFEELLISQSAFAKGFREIVDFFRLTFEAMNDTIDPMEDNATAAMRLASVFEFLGQHIKIITAALAALGVVFTVTVFGTWGWVAAIGAAVAALGLWIAADSNLEATLNNTNTAIENSIALTEDLAEARKRLAEFDEEQARFGEGGGAIGPPQDPRVRGELEGAILARRGELIQQINLDLAAVKDLERRIAEAQQTLARPGLGPFGVKAAREAKEFIEDTKNKKTVLEELIVVQEKELKQINDRIDVLEIERRNAARVTRERIARAGELARELLGFANQRKQSIAELKDEIDVLNAELRGGEAAAALEKLLQQTGFAGEGSKTTISLKSLNAELVRAQENLEKVRLDPRATEQDIKLAEDLVVTQEKLIEQYNKATKGANEEKAEILALSAARQTLIDKIQAEKDARKEAEALQKKREAAARAFQRFRVNQLAQLEKQIILEQTANKERKKAELVINLINRAVAAGVEVNQAYIDSLFTLADKLEEVQGVGDSFIDGFKIGAKEFIEDVGTFAEQSAELFKSTFQTLEDQLVAFVEKGKFSFAELAETIRSQLLRAGIRNILAGTLRGIPGLEDPGGTAQQAATAHLYNIRKTLEEEKRDQFKPEDIDPILHKLDAINNSILNLGAGVGTSFQAPATGGPAAPGYLDQGLQLATNILSSYMQNTAARGIENSIRFQAGGISDAAARRAVGIGASEIPALLHPNEAVVPLTRDGRIPLDIVNGQAVVSLPGAGRVIPTSAGLPHAKRAVAAAVGAHKGMLETLGIEQASNENVLAFLGAPRFQTGTDSTGYDWSGLFSSIGTGLLQGLQAAGTGVLQGAQFVGQAALKGLSQIGIDRELFSRAGEGILSRLAGFRDLFTGPTGLAGLFGGEGALADIPGAITSGFKRLSDSTFGQAASRIARDPLGQLGQGLRKAGAFLGIGGQPADAGRAADPGAFGTVGGQIGPPLPAKTGLAAGFEGVKNITEGAERFLQGLPIIGNLLGDKPGQGYDRIAKGLVLASLFFAPGGGGDVKTTTTIRPTGRVIGFKDAAEAELTEEELEALEQALAGRKALGGIRSGLRAGNIAAFAAGGVVGSPTLAMVGETAPEAIIPLQGGAVPVRVTGNAPTGRVINNNVSFNIVTPDADSFRESQSQILATTANSLNRITRRQQ
jgi:TP901 family phage tail tape measure protein